MAASVNANATVTATTGAASVSLSVTNGDLILVSVVAPGGTLPSGSDAPIYDPTGSSIVLTLIDSASNGSGAAVGVYYCIADATGSKTITTNANPGTVDVVCLDIIGAETCTVPEQHNNGTGSSTSPSTSSFTSTAKGMQIIAVGSPSANTLSGGLTDYNGTGGFGGICIIATGQSAGSYTPAATLSSSVQWGAVGLWLDDATESSISLAPTVTTVAVNATVTIVPTAHDQCSNVFSDTYSFSITSGLGSVNGSGVYTAPGGNTVAKVLVTGISGGKTATATITVLGSNLLFLDLLG
jgi:hypothetical protein